ncbi:MAG: CoA-binding protein [Armatimonadota bacterium]
MFTQSTIDALLAQQTLAVVGVSRDEKKFGHQLFLRLKAQVYRVIPVNPGAERIGGETCYPSLAAVPEAVGGAIILTPPAETERVVREAQAAGITRLFMQPGTESPAAIRYCEEQGVEAVHGHCLLLFLQPCTFPHSLCTGGSGRCWESCQGSFEF